MVAITVTPFDADGAMDETVCGASTAVIYTGSMLVLLVIALRFVNPTQLVTRLKETPT